MIPLFIVLPCVRSQELILVICSSSYNHFFEFLRQVAYKSFDCNLNKRSHSEFGIPVDGSFAFSQIITKFVFSLFYQLFTV